MDSSQPVQPAPEIKKIEVSQNDQVQVGAKRRLPKKRVFIAVVVVLLIFAAAIIIPTVAVVRNAQATAEAGRVLVQKLKAQDLAGAQENIPIVRSRIQQTQSSLTPLVWVKFIPFVGGYYRDAEHGLAAGIHGVDALEIAIQSLEPYADLLGLKGESSFVAGSAEERLQVAVQTMDKLTPNLAEIGEKVELLNAEIAQVNPNRYPARIGNTPVRQQLVSAKALVEETSQLFINARPFLEELPELLGANEPKRYFVIFQNDKELRPTGGFITAFAIFRIDTGKPLVERSEDIYVLDEQQGIAPSAPEVIRTYHKGVFRFHLRDSNISPDFAVSMQQFQDLYRDDFDFDGIIAVDTYVLVRALEILGNFDVAGRTFTSEIDERCDCPNVVYELEDYATRPVAYVREGRKDILGALLLQIMQRALGVSPSQYWGSLFQMGLDQINEKHILAYMRDEKAQRAVESLNMGGRIANGSSVLGYTDDNGWDYLHINDANFAGAKSNLFVEEEVTIDYELNGDEITKTVTIDYKNPFPPSDCNLESGGLCLNGLLRNWVRIYVPKGSQLLEASGVESPQDGRAVDMLTKEELGKTVFEGFVTVRPQGAAQLMVKYTVPVRAIDDYRMLVQKQPGTDAHSYTITVNGKQRQQFNLKTDQVVQLAL